MVTHKKYLKSKGLRVTASPFNRIKLRLAIIILFVPTLWISLHYTIADDIGQVMVLAAYSLITTIWLIYQIRAILYSVQDKRSDSSTKNVHIKSGLREKRKQQSGVYSGK